MDLAPSCIAWCAPRCAFPGVQIWCTPVTESAGANATLTITLATNATSDGSFKYWLDGELIELAVYTRRHADDCR
jgi:phage tail sheath gpL-like